MNQLNLKDRTHDLHHTLEEVGTILSKLKSEKDEYLFHGNSNTIVAFIIFSYKRFNDLLAQDKDALIKIPQENRWEHLLKHSSDYLELIAVNMKEISTINPCLRGLDEAFNISQYNKLVPTDIQKKIIEMFTNIDLSETNYSHDEITNIVTGFVESAYAFGLEEDSPYTVNRLVIHLLDPKEGDSFYNPYCGVGNGIVAAINYLREKAILNKNSQEINQLVSSISLHGDESGEYYVLALLRLALMNIKDKIILNDSILWKNTSDKHKPSIIFCNFYNRFNQNSKNIAVQYEENTFIIPKNFIEIVFLFYSLKKLNKTGRMAITIPEEALSAESVLKIRRFLIEKDYLEAVISELDGPVLLILNKNKDLNRKGKVAFIKANKSYNMPDHFTDVLYDYDYDSEFPITIREVNRITDIYKSFKTDNEKDIIVNVEHFKLLKYNLSPELYTANLIGALNTFGKDNIAFVELSELVDEIREAKRYDEKPPADHDPNLLWVNKSFFDNHVSATAVKIRVEDLINQLSERLSQNGGMKPA